MEGSETRFRVLMTTLVASLDFLPVALATSVGAAVAETTIVIGGLFPRATEPGVGAELRLV
jgi:Cu/Ag efflux pump CusA